MTAELRPAAQYIRMSTDRQDLSPLIQMQMIGNFARDNGFQLVRTYEDQGRSGMRITNRPGLRQLMLDVVDGADFRTVLVYDVSRWGRFQDADASAYYEYHCRLHDVQVIYVAEPFGESPTPLNALLKSMKRVMAAEYSRDLGVKARAGQARVVEMGYHMGPLPPLGYRRCSVSSDGKRHVALEMSQRKLALTDRVKWVLAPEPEVALVRRICETYARSKLDLWQIARLVANEQWLTVRGRPVQEGNLRKLIRNEALIGNFVWGVSGQTLKRRIVNAPPTRMNGSVPRIIDDETWLLMQRRLATSSRVNLCTVPLPSPSRSNSALERIALAGRDDVTRSQHSLARRILARNRLAHSRELGLALEAALNHGGLRTVFDAREVSLYVERHRIRLKLMWREGGDWWVPRIRTLKDEAAVLLVQMEAEYRPISFYMIPGNAAPRGDQPLQTVVQALELFCCRGPQALMEAVAALPPKASERRKHVPKQVRRF